MGLRDLLVLGIRRPRGKGSGRRGDRIDHNSCGRRVRSKLGACVSVVAVQHHGYGRDLIDPNRMRYLSHW